MVGHRLRKFSQLQLAGAHGIFRQYACGDIRAFHKDADHLIVFVAQRLVHQVHVALLRRRSRRALQHHRHGRAKIRFAAGVDLVQQLVKTLAFDVWNRLAHRLAQHVAVAHQLHIGWVDQVKHMLGALQHGHEAGCLGKQAVQTLALAADTLLRAHFFGRLDHHGQHAPDAAFNVTDG